MRLTWKLSLFTTLFILFAACIKGKNRSGITSPPAYDLLHPTEIKLPSGLAEISGISFYPKDTSVFAISDEDGYLFKIFLTHKDSILKWKYDKKHDFEDIVLHDSVFYSLVSNGDIKTFRISPNDSIRIATSKFPDASKKHNEFESLFYDDSLNKPVMICKDCEDDGHKIVSSWTFDPASGTYSPGPVTIDAHAVAEKLGLKKIKLKPSAAAINPLTNELYILCSVNKLLVITDRAGRLKEFYELDPAIYKQPEGIAFTPWGDLIISNEAHETGLANILVIKRKTKV